MLYYLAGGPDMSRRSSIIVLLLTLILISSAAIAMAQSGAAVEENSWGSYFSNVSLGQACADCYKVISPFFIAVLIVIVCYEILK
jgi:hypothetical protein